MRRSKWAAISNSTLFIIFVYMYRGVYIEVFNKKGTMTIMC